MKNEEKTQEIVNDNFEWVSNFVEKNNLSKEDRNQIRFKMYGACQEMAQWKDDYYYKVITEIVGAAYNSCEDHSEIDEVLKKYNL